MACKPDSVPRRRVLHGDEAATIHLDTPLPGTSSGLPAGSGEQPSGACAAAPHLRHSWPCSGWGLPSQPGHPACWCALTAPFHPYHRRRRRGAVCFLWHFPARRPVAVTDHPALWSPDFPRTICRLCPPWSGEWSAAAQPTHPPYNVLLRAPISPKRGHNWTMPQVPPARYLSGPRIWSTPATPRPSPSTISPRRPGCRGPISAGCSPGRSANPRARICNAASRTRRGAAAPHRPVGCGYLRDGRPAECRVVHHQFRQCLRRAACRVPGEPAAGVGACGCRVAS